MPGKLRSRSGVSSCSSIAFAAGMANGVSIRFGPFRYSMRKAGFANGSASTPTSRRSARASARVRFLQPDLPAVLITGYTDAIDPGASTLPVLAKPFRAAELARAVAEAIKGSAAM